MAPKRLEHLWREPATALKSAILSAGYDHRAVRDLPIVCSWSARVVRARDARVSLGGQLFVGYWPESERRKGGGGGLGPPGSRRGVLTIGAGSTFSTGGWVILGPGVETAVGDGATLSLGAATYVTADSQLLCRERIEIGSDCAISFGVLVMDSDMHKISVEGELRPDTGPVVIGDHVWIGAGATILKGARIGDGAVIGAGSVVTGDIPPGTLAAGTPARVRREHVEWW